MGYMFHCTPDCPKRTPGCHDHCKEHKEAKAAYEARKAELNKYKACDQYIARTVICSRDNAGKRNRSGPHRSNYSD